MKYRIKILILILVLGMITVYAQTPVDQDDVIRVDSNVTNLPLTVTDEQRRFFTTLRAEDIRVLEDGVPQTLFTFQRETDRPVAIAFLIDVSGSQEKTLPLEKAAVRAFIEKVVQSNKDMVAIVPFTGLAYLEQEMTRDVLSAYRVLQQVEIGYPAYMGAGRPLTGIRTGPGLMPPPEEGMTSINDAVALTATRVMATTPGLRRRAMILLSDGRDTASRLTLKDAVDRTLAAEAMVYSIGIGGTRLEPIKRDLLRDLAKKTGGRAFFPDKEEELTAAFMEIQQELRTQYLLAYTPSNKKRDGSYRKITVEITNPELKKEKLVVRHRPGYFAK
jgi:Ca-activated chloride channel family protein